MLILRTYLLTIYLSKRTIQQMSKIIIIACALIATLINFSCTPKPLAESIQQAQKHEQAIQEMDKALKAHEEWKKQHTDKLNSPAAAVNKPRVVSIGMGISEVRELCGRADDVNSLVTETGVSFTSRYTYNSDRSEKGCWGTFSFRDGTKLTSIFR